MTAQPARLAVVTGGARGIGAAAVAALCRSGDRVVVCDRDTDGLGPVGTAPTPGTACGFLADVRHLDQLDALVEFLAGLGGAAVLVNNAAEVALLGTESATPDEFTRVMETNVRAYWYLAVKLADQLAAHHGSIVNVGSTHPMQTKRSSFPYNTSKGAVLALSKSLAVDLGDRGIRVNTVLPGICDTEPTRTWIAAQPDPIAAAAGTLADHPLGRLPTVDDVAEAIHFLCSSAARGISGAELIVDCGRQVMRR